jgi:hypothetical protein
MRGAIDSAHAAAAEAFIQTVFVVKDAPNQRIDRNIGNRFVSSQRREVIWTDVYVVGELAATSGALQHDEI